MKKSTKRWLSGVALVAGATGAVATILMKNNHRKPENGRWWRRKTPDVWARPGMEVIFRAELMPGRGSSERTFKIVELLPSGRVLLDGVSGEHAETEFQRIR